MSVLNLRIPCQPTPSTAGPPSGRNWVHEIKHDGYRLIARRDDEKIALYTRNGNNRTDRFPSIVSALHALRCVSCHIDGEAVVCDEQGLASFNLLRTGSRVKAQAFLYAFDLIEIDGEDLRLLPLIDRKARLERLLKGAKPGLQLVEHIAADGPTLFRHACALGCEGIVSKRLDSRYRSGPSRDWVKTKNPQSAAVRREASEEWGRPRVAPTPA